MYVCLSAPFVCTAATTLIVLPLCAAFACAAATTLIVCCPCALLLCAALVCAAATTLIVLPLCPALVCCSCVCSGNDLDCAAQAGHGWLLPEALLPPRCLGAIEAGGGLAALVSLDRAVFAGEAARRAAQGAVLRVKLQIIKKLEGEAGRGNPHRATAKGRSHEQKPGGCRRLMSLGWAVLKAEPQVRVAGTGGSTRLHDGRVACGAANAWGLAWQGLISLVRAPSAGAAFRHGSRTVVSQGGCEQGPFCSLPRGLTFHLPILCPTLPLRSLPLCTGYGSPVIRGAEVMALHAHRHMVSMVDRCCRLPLLQHMPLKELHGLAAALREATFMPGGGFKSRPRIALSSSAALLAALRGATFMPGAACWRGKRVVREWQQRCLCGGSLGGHVHVRGVAMWEGCGGDAAVWKAEGDQLYTVERGCIHARSGPVRGASSTRVLALPFCWQVAGSAAVPDSAGRWLRMCTQGSVDA